MFMFIASKNILKIFIKNTLIVCKIYIKKTIN